MINIKKIKPDYLIVLILLLVQLYPCVLAQQNIIEIPSSNILQEGEVIFKDSNNFRPFNPGEYVSIGPAVGYGFGHGFNVMADTGISLEDTTDITGRFAVKKVFFLPKAIRFTVESKIKTSFMEATTPSNITFAHFSKTIRKTRTTLTAGMYLANDKSFLPDDPGAVLGLEQSLFIKSLKLAVDWTSGNKSYGRIAAGLKYRITPTLSITNAILIPNGNNGKLAFKISLSKYFTPKNFYKKTEK